MIKWTYNRDINTSIFTAPLIDIERYEGSIERMTMLWFAGIDKFLDSTCGGFGRYKTLDGTGMEIEELE